MLDKDDLKQVKGIISESFIDFWENNLEPYLKRNEEEHAAMRSDFKALRDYQQSVKEDSEFLVRKSRQNTIEHDRIFVRLDKSDKDHKKIFSKLDTVTAQLKNHEKRVTNLEIITSD